MKNVTITLDEDLARWAKVEAAKEGKSLSKWIADFLAAERARPRPQPATARQMSALATFLDGPGFPGLAEALPSRDELYERSPVRGHERSGLQPRPGGARKAS